MKPGNVSPASGGRRDTCGLGSVRLMGGEYNEMIARSSSVVCENKTTALYILKEPLIRRLF